MAAVLRQLLGWLSEPSRTLPAQALPPTDLYMVSFGDESRYLPMLRMQTRSASALLHRLGLDPASFQVRVMGVAQPPTGTLGTVVVGDVDPWSIIAETNHRLFVLVKRLPLGGGGVAAPDPLTGACSYWRC